MYSVTLKLLICCTITYSNLARSTEGICNNLITSSSSLTQNDLYRSPQHNQSQMTTLGKDKGEYDAESGDGEGVVSSSSSHEKGGNPGPPPVPPVYQR